MNITIDIECETIAELLQHLHVLKEEVFKKSVELKLPTMTEELPEETVIEDSNCYGTHTLTVLMYEE